MTNQEKLQKVREAIISKVPEIMELKEGCQIEYLDGIHNGNQPRIKTLKMRGEIRGFLPNNKYYCSTQKGKIRVFNFSNLAILGSKIGIAQVLRACKKLRKELLTKNNYGEIGSDSHTNRVDQWSEVFENADVENELEYLWYNWILDKDDINLQKPETIDFLFNIFYPNEKD